MDKVPTPLMKQYQEIKEQHKDCLLLFRLGDFYELFFEDAKIAAAALDIVLTSRSKEDNIPMCGIPAHASDNYIARLIKKGHRVAICEQMETPANKQGKGPVRREVIRIITPGTLTEDSLLDPRAPNFLMALFFEHGHLGIAFVDISTGNFFMESQPLQALPSVLTRLQPQEILAPDNLLQEPAFSSCWQEWKKRITPLPKARFDRGEERLASFFNVQTIKSFGNFSSWEIAAAGGLIDYLLLTQKRHLLMLERPRRLDQHHFLEMDAFTRRNLEILQTFSGNKKGSLLSILDCTVTAIGARLLFLRLTHPLKQLFPINHRLDSVEFFVQRPSERRALRELLASLSDIERSLSRILMGRGTPLDMGALRTALKILPSLPPLFVSSTLPPELARLASALEGHPPLSAFLQKALNEELPALAREGGIIAPGYHEPLDELRNLKSQGKMMIQQLQDKYIEETRIPTLRIRYNQIIGHYIEVSAAAASKMPFHFILKQSLVSGSRYTTPELMELEQKLLSAEEEARQLEMRLLDEIVEEIRSASQSLRLTIEAIGVYDVSSALAELAESAHYVRPVLDDSRTLSVRGGRHPVVEYYSKASGTSSFTKNSCHLTPEQPIWVMTGPNMAGKSTFLRQNALIALMAHMGSFVPADQAHIGLIDRIFSRVGASDDLARGYSTFMVEMIETATILNQATDKSFVIFDEVGRGTSTYDGLSLAWACVEHLAHSLKCRTLFATHYHELAALRHMPELAFYTLKVKEWESSIVFLHQVVQGVADRSYGLHVARLAGIPETILHRAEAILSQLEHQSSPGIS